MKRALGDRCPAKELGSFPLLLIFEETASSHFFSWGAPLFDAYSALTAAD